MKDFILISFLLVFFIPGYNQAWTKKFDIVDACECGIYRVAKDNKYGYTDDKGNIIIQIIYDDGMSFSEGRAAIKIGQKWGFIDSTGKEIVKPLYTEVYSFHEGLAVVSIGDAFGFIDLSGKLSIPLIYTNAKSFGNKLAPVCNSKNIWGFISRENKVSIPFQFNYADSFSEGTARVMKAGKWVYIDNTGKIVKEGD